MAEKDYKFDKLKATIVRNDKGELTYDVEGIKNLLIKLIASTGGRKDEDLNYRIHSKADNLGPRAFVHSKS